MSFRLSFIAALVLHEKMQRRSKHDGGRSIRSHRKGSHPFVVGRSYTAVDLGIENSCSRHRPPHQSLTCVVRDHGGPFFAALTVHVGSESGLVRFSAILQSSQNHMSGSAFNVFRKVRSKPEYKSSQYCQDKDLDTTTARASVSRSFTATLSRVCCAGYPSWIVRARVILLCEQRGLIPSDELPDFATELLVLGCDTPSLRELAGLPKGDRARQTCGT